MFIDLLIKGLKQYINYVYNYANFSGDLGMAMGSVITVNESWPTNTTMSPVLTKKVEVYLSSPVSLVPPKIPLLPRSPVDSGGDKQTLHIHMNPLSGKTMT